MCEALAFLLSCSHRRVGPPVYVCVCVFCVCEEWGRKTQRSWLGGVLDQYRFLRTLPPKCLAHTAL